MLQEVPLQREKIHTWSYNDTESLSGYYCIKNNSEMEQYIPHIKLTCSGSHLKSLQLLKYGDVDITCIDSNALLYIDTEIQGLRRIGMCVRVDYNYHYHHHYHHHQY